VSAELTLRDALPVDDGGLPLLGWLLACYAGAEQSLSRIRPAYVVVPAHAPADAAAPTPITPLLGLHPNTTYRFTAAAINARGVGAQSAPSLPVRTAALPSPAGHGGAPGRVAAVIAPGGRLKPPVNAEGTPLGCLSGFDPARELAALPGASDRLAALAHLHAAVAVAFAHLRANEAANPRENGSAPLRASDLLEASGLGTGVADLRLDLAAAAGMRRSHGRGAAYTRAGQLADMPSEGEAHALGLWLGISAVASSSASGLELVDTEPAPATEHVLLPGLGGRAAYDRYRRNRVLAAARILNAGDKGPGSPAGGSSVSRLLQPMAHGPRAASLGAESSPLAGGEAWLAAEAYSAMARGAVGQHLAALGAELSGTLGQAHVGPRRLVCTGGICESPALAAAAGAASATAASQLKRALNELPQPCFGPVVTVSDIRELLVTSVSRLPPGARVDGPDFAPTTVAGDLASAAGADAGAASRNASTVAVRAWACAHSPRTHDVRAELVAASAAAPHDALGVPANAHAFAGRVVLWQRGGGLALVDKARCAAAHGAAALVVYDDAAGRCANATFTQRCMPGSDRSLGQGWAVSDPPAAWREVAALSAASAGASMSILLISHAAGALLRDIARASTDPADR
jgi:hypothetical protein